MEKEELILVDEFCNYHQIKVSFIHNMQELGLVQMVNKDERYYLSYNQLSTLNTFISLHYDLMINPEGIDAITHLVNKIKNMQAEILFLKNKLRLYEDTI